MQSSHSLPTLSVIMSSFNYAHYITEAIEAMTAQSYKPLEIFIIDDCSSDNSSEIISRFADKFDNIIFVQNKTNIGGLAVANMGLHMAHGDYVYFAAADDIVLPGFFEKSMKLISLYPDSGFCMSDYMIYYEHVNKYSGKRLNLSSKSCFVEPLVLLNVLRDRDIHIAGQTIIMKRSVMLEIGNFDLDLGSQADWFVDFIACFRHGVCYIPETLAISRVHSNNFYSVKNNKKIKLLYKSIDNMLQLINSPKYLDVSSFFKDSAILSRYRIIAIKYLIVNKKYINFLTPLLIKRALINELFYHISFLVPVCLKKLYNYIYNYPVLPRQINRSK